MAYDKPEGWIAPIKKTWKELKSLAVVPIAVIRKKIARKVAHRTYKVRISSQRHVTVGRKTSETLGRNNHERMMINRRLKK